MTSLTSIFTGWRKAKDPKSVGNPEEKQRQRTNQPNGLPPMPLGICFCFLLFVACFCCCCCCCFSFVLLVVAAVVGYVFCFKWVWKYYEQMRHRFDNHFKGQLVMSTNRVSFLSDSERVVDEWWI